MEDELKVVKELIGSKKNRSRKNSSFEKFCWERKQRNGAIAKNKTQVREQFVILLVGLFVEQ